MQQIVLPNKDSNVLKEVQDTLLNLKLVDVITPFSKWARPLCYASAM